jgi:glycosyltransferase involved in cell wall biosynthesis
MGYRPRQWTIIPNGIDTDQFKPNPEAVLSVRKELGLNSDTFLIAYIARYDPVKDHETFFLGAQQLLKFEPDVHFLLCGSGINMDNPAIATLIEHHGLRKNMHLLGQREDVSRLTAALDIACSTSISEGFSNTIAEAMACGVPCAVTDVGDSAQIVGETGKVVPPSDPQALAEAWEALIRMDPAARAELGVAARRRIQEYYSLETMVSRYRSLYEEILTS